MINDTDTICALATAPGVAGIAVIRVSGPSAFKLVDEIFISSQHISDAPGHTIHYGRLRLNPELQDEVTISVFRAPRSYTGEDVAEISCHGGYVIPDLVIQALLAHGARHAEAGEFTKRAFINGKMDLTQVESVAELIHSSSSAGATIAAKQLHGVFRDNIRSIRGLLVDLCALIELDLDFANEDLEVIPHERIERDINATLARLNDYRQSFAASSILRSGFRVSLVGRPNAGKSLLFNKLIKQNRSIVHDSAGTTRDYIQESVIWDGLRIVFSDTAGLRDATDAVEAVGVERTGSQISDADLILLVNDCSQGEDQSNDLIEDIVSRYPDKKRLILQNKSDLVANTLLNSTIVHETETSPIIYVSAKTNRGLAELRHHISTLAKQSAEPSKEVLLNQRHSELLDRAATHLVKAKALFEANDLPEIVAYELRQGVERLGEILGESFNEEVLHSVFAKFCIGK